MAQKKITIKKRKTKKSHGHIHLWEIPKKYFPRGTKAKEYYEDLIRTTSSLRYTNKNIQYSSQICAFNIKSILPSSHFIPRREDVFSEIEEFVYHYENYCFRLYMYREKLIHFINSFLPIGYEDKEVRIRHILINPVVKQAGLLNVLKKFKDNTVLSNIIDDRERLTHRLFYGQEFDDYFRPKSPLKIKSEEEFKKWSNDWRKEIVARAQRTNKCIWMVDDINNTIAEKLIRYKKGL